MSKKTWNDFIAEKSQTYDMWLRNYKGRTVKDIDVNEHTKWAKEFQAWRVRKHRKNDVKSLTLFKSIFDNKTNKQINQNILSLSFRMLYDLSKYPRKDKKSAQLISPAIYKDDTTRANDNVIGWAGWCAVDVDEHVFDGNLEKELQNKYGLFNYVVYSTASSSIGSDRRSSWVDDVPKDNPLTDGKD